ncbi:MAG TPA: F0F1 ATP synthase subunit delta [Verrucomicrobiae bacterium]|nr:F0F1 ATP synthase subunit delta [Verrucomicrobiae bacterium]
MAELSTLARPYAKAVFGLAQDEGKLAEWSALLSGLATAVRDPKVARAIGHPAVGRGQLADVLVQALGTGATQSAKNLLKLLAEYDRLKLAPEIAGQFEALRAEAEKRVEVQIATAATVDKAQQDALVTAVKKKLNRDVNVTWTTDPSLIAGASIRAGDTVIDGSISGELARLRQILVG